MRIRLLAACVALSSAVLAQTPNLGHIDFPTSGQPEAQKRFIQGVLLLHSFEYEDAAEEFQAASRLDPGFAMAYWGEALTYTHQVWVQQNVRAARAALARLAPTPEARIAKAPTDREKGYLRAVEILYGQGDKVSRDIAYADAMHGMMEKYPDDLEAASLYAVALLGVCQYERQYPIYMQAAAVAEEVFAKNPQHPGAIHYLIHAYDDPVHAPLGLRPARVYAKVAGSASHAQHMPSHIFIALGMWADVVSSNEASVRVEDERIARKGLGPGERNYHALLWLEYAYLQQSRNGDAQRLLDEVAKSAVEARTLGTLAEMRAVYAVETGALDKLTGDFPLPTRGLGSSVQFLTAEGMAAVRNGQPDEGRRLLTGAQEKLAAAAARAAEPGHHGSTSPNDRRSAEIMTKQLEALLLQAKGDSDGALRLLAETTAAEDALSFDFGPPVPLKPAHELYGEVLLEAGRAKEARVEFEKALQRAPKRTLSAQGLAKAAGFGRFRCRPARGIRSEIFLAGSGSGVSREVPIPVSSPGPIRSCSARPPGLGRQAVPPIRS